MRLSMTVDLTYDHQIRGPQVRWGNWLTEPNETEVSNSFVNRLG